MGLSMEEPTKRSDEVIGQYRQHKMSVSVYARIKELLMQFEADNAADRRIAWIGMGIALALLIIAFYVFFGSSQVTLS